MPYSYYYWGFDPTYILVLIGAVICLVASARVKSTYNKYASYRSMSGMTGAQAAERILHSAGIYDVSVQHVSGNLTDHYNPVNKTINLSRDVYYGNSIAAAAVAAHETGHALQHAKGYSMLKLRSTLVPAVEFASHWVQWILLAGILMVNSFPGLLLVGIGLFARKPEAQQRYRRRAGVGEVVERIGGYGDRAGYRAGGILAGKQQHVEEYPQQAAQRSVCLAHRRIRILRRIFYEQF